MLKGEYWKIFVGVLVGEEEEFSFSRVRGFGLGSEGTVRVAGSGLFGFTAAVGMLKKLEGAL